MLEHFSCSMKLFERGLPHLVIGVLDPFPLEVISIFVIAALGTNPDQR